jgi:hypothetical protein
VSDVQLEKNQDVFSGTLHLTDHNLIFSHSEGELWVRENNQSAYAVAQNSCGIDKAGLIGDPLKLSGAELFPMLVN